MTEMFKPRVDAFGKVTIAGSAYGDFRLIESGYNRVALFSGNGGEPEILELEGPFNSNGRKLKATLSDGRSLLFVRAGCGCQTPQSLRGPRSKFLQRLQEQEALDAMNEAQANSRLMQHGVEFVSTDA